ncbi:hypothetical protein DL95DRAFT_469650 [Leptodontidium sp. 2 PMI_412]|nr:hypothetical protein DL95DRAFT_469650 [Leptodontidium sp. 2 PMI_412]
MLLRRGPEFHRDHLLRFTTKKIRSGGFNGNAYRNRTRSETITPRFMSIYMETTSQMGTYMTMKAVFDIFREAEEVFQQASLDSSADSFVQYVVRKLWKSRGLFDYFVRMVNDIAQNHRRIFLTSGGYLGWGSKCIELGDRIAIVAGVTAQLTLRPDDLFMADWFKSEYRCVCSAVVLWPSDIRPLSRKMPRTIKLI